MYQLESCLSPFTAQHRTTRSNNKLNGFADLNGRKLLRLGLLVALSKLVYYDLCSLHVKRLCLKIVNVTNIRTEYMDLIHMDEGDFTPFVYSLFCSKRAIFAISPTVDIGNPSIIGSVMGQIRCSANDDSVNPSDSLNAENVNIHFIHSCRSELHWRELQIVYCVPGGTVVLRWCVVVARCAHLFVSILMECELHQLWRNINYLDFIINDTRAQA